MWMSQWNWFLLHDAMQAQPMPSSGVRLTVTFVDSVEMNKHVCKIFSPSDSHTILVLPYQTSWQYSDRNPSKGGIACRLTGKNCDSEAVSGSIACCELFERQGNAADHVELMTLITGKRQSLLMAEDNEVFDRKPQRYTDDNRVAFNCTQC